MSVVENLVWNRIARIISYEPSFWLMMIHNLFSGIGGVENIALGRSKGI